MAGAEVADEAKRSIGVADEAKRSVDAAADKAAKRARVGATESVRSCFHPGLLDTAEELSRAFSSALPFKHACISPFCSEKLLQGVRQEMLERLHFTQKETDIFKYHQSGDLANLDGLPDSEKSQLPCLRQLRDAIYSQEFRDFVSAITGCGPLSGSRTDMSTNRYKQGDHLLLHDDVIGDRRVSYIIYLPDPEVNGGEGWRPEDGGHLELYPRESDESWAPAVCPTERLCPRWNQIVFFTVLPGQSHHSVEEVAGEGKERLSIQGWFHYPQPGEPGYDPNQMQSLWSAGAVSTLSQVEAKRQREAGCVGDEFDGYAHGAVAVDGPELDAEDREYLAQFINAEYLDPKIIAQVADRFTDESHIELGKFLDAGVSEKLAGLLQAIDKHDGVDTGRIPVHGTGERGRWHAFGPPVIRRFMRLDGPAVANSTVAGQAGVAVAGEAEATDLLARIRDMFASRAYARWAAGITTLALNGRRGMVRRFRPGLDFTLGTPDCTTGSTLDAVLCLARQPELWADGGVGGYQCYVDGGSDEASNDGSVYRRSGDDDSILLTKPASWNTLSLVMREPGVVKFVKYVSAAAPGSRWDVSFEFQVADDEVEQ
ncbi:putative component of NuA3 histone acetyltransferase complex [Coemansia sp. RSA 552]|nr:putative component of NuA3 histone acetyltransferase complex [Coemansia sp. RSA 552]